MCVSPRTGCPAEDGGSNSDGHREASLELLKRVQAFFLPTAGVPDHLGCGA